MFYTKNKSKTTHDAFADKFNHKKTIRDDNTRFKNINNKINSTVKVDITGFNNNNSEEINSNTDNTKKSANVEIQKYFINDAYTNINIPKIMCKEILEPTYLEADNFDFTMINKNITTHMVMTFEQQVPNVNIGILHRNGVKVINNVYQELYRDKIKPTGFGDFIRGCYYLLQFCNRHKFEPKVFIYNSIAEFLINHSENYDSKIYDSTNYDSTNYDSTNYDNTNYDSKNYDSKNYDSKNYDSDYDIYQKLNRGVLSNIPMFVKNNWVDCVLDPNNYIVGCTKSNHVYNDFVRYLCQDVDVVSNNIFIYNIMFPEDEEITPDDKIYIQLMLQPTCEMSEYVDETLKNLRFNKKKYNVIHIRSGDKYLCENSTIFATAYIKKIVNEVFLIFNNNKDTSDYDYLLVADNNEIKRFLMEIYPNIKSLLLDIIHLGNGSVLERQKVKNTLLDFYLLSNSNAIHSFTSYPHGSGFSYWCAKTYDIPYSCKYITL
jgi:hypothetical protein